MVAEIVYKLSMKEHHGFATEIIEYVVKYIREKSNDEDLKKNNENFVDSFLKSKGCNWQYWHERLSLPEKLK